MQAVVLLLLLQRAPPPLPEYYAATNGHEAETAAARSSAVRFYECLMVDTLPDDCLALLDDPESFLEEPWTGRRGGPAARRAWAFLKEHRPFFDLGATPRLVGGPVLVRYLALYLGPLRKEDGPTVVLEARVDGKRRQVMLPLTPTHDPRCPYAVNITAASANGTDLIPPPVRP